MSCVFRDHPIAQIDADHGGRRVINRLPRERAVDKGKEVGDSLVSKVFIMNADGSSQKNLTGAGDHWGPIWSPDGKRIVFLQDEPHPDPPLDHGRRRLQADGQPGYKAQSSRRRRKPGET